jgi:V8-like Glu-specific endopeptidase
MKVSQALIILSLLVVSGHSLASIKGKNVIYGLDNRIDPYASKDSVMVELSRSTAAMIDDSKLTTANGQVTLTGRFLRDKGICQDQHFSNQLTVASCSGFIISDKYLVTAGHCIRNQNDCDTYKWVFDYKLDHADQTSITVPESSVYSCKKIISTTLDYTNNNDYALIELDRSVTDRRPLSFRRSGKIEKDTPIAVIGHPTGLPTKIADGATVRSLQGQYFTANLDTFSGNSGSAVLNMITHEVEGILVRGDTDYVYDAAKGCQVSKVCSDIGCRGEDATYITNVPGISGL